MKEIIDAVWNATPQQVMNAIIGMGIGSLIGCLILWYFIKRYFK